MIENTGASENEAVRVWVDSLAQLCQPTTIHWCDGSDAENTALIKDMVAHGTLIKLDPVKRPRSYLCRSDPRDVARVESRTFISSKNKNDAGPTNKWIAPEQRKARISPLYTGPMPR